MNETRFINKKDVNNFKELGVNKILIDEFEKNEKKINMIESIKSFKSNFPNDKIVDNIEIGRECIEKGLVITPLNKCEFIIPLEAVDKIVEFKANIGDNITYKNPENFLILYPLKYYNLKDKEIPLDEIEVYYNPYFSFYLDNFSIELLEMKKKPKKVSMIKQANALLEISRSNIPSFYKAIPSMIAILILFGIISAIIFVGIKSIIISSIIFLLYFIILFHAFNESVLQPFRNKDEILEKNKEIDFIYYLRRSYNSSAFDM